MRIAAIICEYNPFHKGHQAHIAWTKQRTDAVVCLMSGSFVQRGEPALFDKFTRARWALQAGADIVLELPVVGVLQSAQGFARTGVFLADAIGADALSFGVEEADTDSLYALARLEDQEAYAKRLQQHLAQGCSYPAAAQRAAQEMLPSLSEKLFGPNCTLAIEYIRAIERYQSPLHILPMPRNLPISSTVCRRQYCAHQSLDALLPPFVLDSIPSVRSVTITDLAPLFLYRLRMMTPADFAALPGCSEGIEQRLYRAGRTQTSLSGLLSATTTARYPLSRVKRLLCNALLGVTADMQSFYRDTLPYARLLGLSRTAGNVMTELRRRAHIPLVDKPVAWKYDPLFSLEQRATDVHALCMGQPCGLDFSHPLALQGE